MPDETTQVVDKPTGATPTPPPPPAASATPTIESGNGHVDAKDFAHPELGTKIKNLHDDWQSKSQKLSAAEKRALDAETRNKSTEAWFRDPRNAPQIRAWLDTTYPQAPAAGASTEETDDDKRERLIKESVQHSTSTQLAQWEMFARLGGGDPEKGRVAYSTPDPTSGRSIQQDVNDLLDVIIKGDPRQVSNLALEIVQSRRPKPTPEAPGTVRTETGRGTSEVPAPPSIIRNAKDALAAAGFSSESDYLRAVGRL